MSRFVLMISRSNSKRRYQRLLGCIRSFITSAQKALYIMSREVRQLAATTILPTQIIDEREL